VPIDTRVRRFHHLTQASGVLVLEALEGGPAAAAGVQSGDVMVSLDGAPISIASPPRRRSKSGSAPRAGGGGNGRSSSAAAFGIA
jgi:S1-C subfamily serine protease